MTARNIPGRKDLLKKYSSRSSAKNRERSEGISPMPTATRCFLGADSSRISSVEVLYLVEKAARGIPRFGYSGDGGPALDAQFFGIAQLAHDGIITTVAGKVPAGTAAVHFKQSRQLRRPQSVTIDPQGNRLIADAFNRRVIHAATIGGEIGARESWGEISRAPISPDEVGRSKRSTASAPQRGGPTTGESAPDAALRAALVAARI